MSRFTTRDYQGVYYLNAKAEDNIIINKRQVGFSKEIFKTALDKLADLEDRDEAMEVKVDFHVRTFCFCPACEGGEELSTNWEFCPHCGQRIKFEEV